MSRPVTLTERSLALSQMVPGPSIGGNAYIPCMFGDRCRTCERNLARRIQTSTKRARAILSVLREEVPDGVR